MSVIFKTLDYEVELESLPDYEGVKNRFLNGFTQFVEQKKYKAITRALQEELGPAYPADDAELIASIGKRLNDNALVEKPFLFLSVNSERSKQLV